MNYTIATMDDVFGNITIDFSKSGNKYVVGIWNKETKESTTISFGNIDDAFGVFGKLSEAIIKGLYSYEERRAILKEYL